jgi:hypothetical protein
VVCAAGNFVCVEQVMLLSLICQTYSDFFNWNKVKIRYCDGASFAGHPESEVRVSLPCWGLCMLHIKIQLRNSFFFTFGIILMRGFFLTQNNYYIQKKGSGLFFRGQIIWEAIMNELLSIGMSKAKQVKL